MMIWYMTMSGIYVLVTSQYEYGILVITRVSWDSLQTRNILLLILHVFKDIFIYNSATDILSFQYFLMYAW